MAESGWSSSSSSKDARIDETVMLLDRWVKVFDRSQATTVPADIPLRRPGRSSQKLKVEDVKESVTEEVIPGKGRFSRCNHDHGHESSIPKKPKKWEIERQREKEKRQREKEQEWARERERQIANKQSPGKRKLSKKSKSLPVVPTFTPSVSKPSSDSTNGSGNHQPSNDATHSEKKESEERSESRQSSGRPQSRQPSRPPSRRPSTVGEPISLETARSLRELLMGSAYTSFNADWRKQHINFSSNTSYGLSFYKAGPDGVMACIQALMLRYLLFSKDEPAEDLHNLLKPSENEREEALILAFSHILWHAGGCKEAIVVLPLSKECNWLLMKDYREDRLTELLHIFRFGDENLLKGFLKKNLFHFSNTSGNGCILVLYSAILSRGIIGVTSDISEPDPMLMGPHDSCTQAMINLMLVGRAVGNVFNGTIEVDEFGDWLKYPKRGVLDRGEVGFLTISEHLDVKHFEVGSRLKTPKYPIWVVDIGGRYSVVFCLRRDLVNDWKLERYFELHIYNGEAHQVHKQQGGQVAHINTREPWIPELDLDEPTTMDNCLRTKWPGALIEWEHLQPQAPRK